MITRTLITIAVGKPYYLKLAENLLLSFMRWNSDNDIHFLLLTDNPGFFERYQQPGKVSIQMLALAEADKSFTSKFMLLEHAIANENLFVDCDCLVYRDLGFVFDAFAGKSFSTIGTPVTSGEFFCDVEKTLQQFGISVLPQFVGCVYYFRQDEASQAVFATAIQLKARYDEAGFIRLRNQENEEPLFAVAMAIHGQTVIPDTGAIKADTMFFENLASDVLSGVAEVSEPIRTITGNHQVPDHAAPAILHFNGPYAGEYLYRSEAYRLQYPGSTPMARLSSNLKFLWPGQLNKTTRKVFRPIYRFFFGYREVRQDERSV